MQDMIVNHSPRGVTALEAVIATTIFAVVIAMSFMLTFSATRSFDEKILMADLQTKGERCIKTMQDTVGEAQALSTNDITQGANTFYDGGITFTVPCTYNTYPDNNLELNTTPGASVWYEANGRPTWTPTPGTWQYYNGGPPPPPRSDFTLFLKWGWRDDNRMAMNLDSHELMPVQGPGMHMNPADVPPGIVLDANGKTPVGYMQFRFVQDTGAGVGTNGVFSEAVEGIDIDGDGLKTSSYAVGYIEQAIYIGTYPTGTVVSESLYTLASSNVLQPLPGDSSKTGDPTLMKTNRIFVFDSNTSKLNMNLYLLSVSARARLPHLAHCQTTVFLRNSADGN